MSERAEALFAQWVEHHVLHGEELDPEALCADRPDLLPELKALIARYLDVSGSLDGLSRVGGGAAAAPRRPRRSRSSRASGPSSASARAGWGRSTSSTT